MTLQASLPSEVSLPSHPPLGRVLDADWNEVGPSADDGTAYAGCAVELCEQRGVLFVRVFGDQVREPRYVWNGRTVDERTDIGEKDRATHMHVLSETIAERSSAAAALRELSTSRAEASTSAENPLSTAADALERGVANSARRLRDLERDGPSAGWRYYLTLASKRVGRTAWAHALAIAAALGLISALHLAGVYEAERWSLEQAARFCAGFLTFELLFVGFDSLISRDRVVLIVGGIAILVLLGSSFADPRSLVLLVAWLLIGIVIDDPRGASEESWFRHDIAGRAFDRSMSVDAYYRLALLAQTDAALKTSLRPLGIRVLEQALTDIENARLTRIQWGMRALMAAQQECEDAEQALASASSAYSARAHAWDQSDPRARSMSPPDATALNRARRNADRLRERHSELVARERGAQAGIERIAFLDRQTCFANFACFYEPRLAQEPKPRANDHDVRGIEADLPPIRAARGWALAAAILSVAKSYHESGVAMLLVGAAGAAVGGAVVFYMVFGLLRYGQAMVAFARRPRPVLLLKLLVVLAALALPIGYLASFFGAVKFSFPNQ